MPFRLLAAGLVLVAAASAAAQTPKAGDVTLAPGTVDHRGTEYAVEYGTLRVPMNRSDPESGLIRLSFVRYPSTSPDPGPPLVYLAGGPGGSGIGTMSTSRGQMFLSLLDGRDFIAFDQRGTGRSEPGNLRFATGAQLPMDRPADPALYCEIAQDAARGMLAAMAERGVDVRGLTTEESADDLDALRAALGAEKLVLWGSSYGTHLALATARRHPEGVAAVILAGTEGPDHSYKLPSNIDANLERLGALVREDPVYAELMPDLPGTVRRVLDDLEANPRTVTIVPGLTVTVGAWDLRKALATPMGSRGGMEELPARVYAMSHGEFFDLAQWAVGNRRSGARSAMGIVMDCASYGSAARLARIEREDATTILGATIDFPFPCLCEVDGMPRLGDDFRARIESDVPALFISGTLDGRTPVSNAEEIAQGFARHQHLVIRNAAHGGDLFESSPRILASVRAFLRGETIPDTLVDGPAWEFEPPFERSLAHFVLTKLTTEGYDATVAHYRRIRAETAGKRVYDFDDAILNDLGYTVMNNDLTDLAIEIFRLNTVGHPEAFNVWDSLGEAYMIKGDREKAIANYEKSLELNPGNDGAVRAIANLRAGGVP